MNILINLFLLEANKKNKRVMGFYGIMLLEDGLAYPRYQRVVDGNNKYKPNELKHVFDTTTGRYTTNELNCCYYSPANIKGLKFTSNNTDIVSISGENLIAENIGNCKITGTKNNEEALSFKVIVYGDKKPNRKFKNTLLLPLNKMINIEGNHKNLNTNTMQTKLITS